MSETPSKENVNFVESPFCIKSAKEFINSSGFKRYNKEHAEDKEYLKYIEEHPEVLEEGNLVRVENTVWPREIVDGTTERGRIIRELIYLSDKVDKVNRALKIAFRQLVPIDITNALDEFKLNGDVTQAKNIISDIHKENERYEKILSEINKFIEQKGRGIFESYVSVSSQRPQKTVFIADDLEKAILSSAGEYSEYNENRFLYDLDKYLREGDFSDLQSARDFFEFLKDKDITEESVEKLRQRIKDEERAKQNKKAKKAKKELISYLEDRNDYNRKRHVQIAIRSIDIGGESVLSRLGSLTNEQLGKLVETTKEIEELQKELDYNIPDFAKRFVRQQHEIVEGKYNVNLDINNFPQTKRDLEIFVKVSRAVSEVARDYGLNSVDELAQQEDIWEDDIFPKIDK